MTTPTLEEYMQGATTWNFQYGPLTYILSHHGHLEPYPGFSYLADGHPGTWCYYLIVREQMFPHRWPAFKCTRNENGFEEPGPGWNSDIFDTQIAWSSSEPYYDRRTEKQWDASKVGCDYNHLWHRESGYPDTFESVKQDAERTVKLFLEQNPDHYIRCSYSGVWSEQRNFYTSKNGGKVHIDLGKALEDHPSWGPEQNEGEDN